LYAFLIFLKHATLPDHLILDQITLILFDEGLTTGYEAPQKHCYKTELPVSQITERYVTHQAAS
jgi:hypothetical protein